MRVYLSTLFLAACFMLGVCHVLQGQWLVPNNSFEVYGACPDGQLSYSELSIPPWMNGNSGSCDYFNICGTNGAEVPSNWAGFEYPADGNAYAGLFVRSNGGGDYREYLQTILVDPLVAGVTYHVSFYVSLAENFCAATRMGAYFSDTPPPFNGNAYIDVDPQIEYPFGMIQSLGWTLVSGCFVAQGGELYITIGNFYPDSETPLDPDCANPLNNSYYFVDLVIVDDGPPAEIIPVDIGDNISSCPTYTINPGVPDVGYTWNDGSTLPTLDVIQSGEYTLTVTDGCNYGIDSVDIFIEGTFDDVEIGPPAITLCQGDVYHVNLDPQWSYTWQDGSTDALYAIASPGSYSVQMYDGCDIQTDTMIVNVLAPPAPFSLGIDSHLCAGDAIVYNFDNDLGYFEWQDGSTEAAYTITSGGTYALTISNACFETSDTITFDYVLQPVLELGNDVYFCQGDSLTLEVDPSQGNYTWEDGSNETTYTITSEGTYSVTVSNICGVASDDVYVEEYIEPPLELGPDLTICPAQLPYVLDGSNIDDATFLQWQDGSNDDTYSVNSAGSYSLIASNSCFTSQDVINIAIGDATPSVVLPDDTRLCEGDSILLINSGSQGDYLWSDHSQGDTLWVYTTGTYSLTITSACGTGSDEILISEVPVLATPDLGPDEELCPGDAVALQVNIPDVAYQWQDGSSADSLIVTTPGIYHVTITDQCGASAADTVIISAGNAPPVLSLIDQISLCQGNTMVIESGITGVSYLWSDGTQLTSLEVSTPGAYSLTVSNSCGTDADTVVVTDGGPSPVVDLGPDISICPAEEYELIPVFSNIDAWTWSDGTSGPSITVSDAGAISIQANNGCGNTTDTVMVSLLPEVPPLALGNDTVLCPGDQIALNIVIPGVSIDWSDGSHGNTFQIISGGTYYATISNVCNASSDTIRVNELPAAPVLDLGNDQLLCIGETIVIDPQLSGVNYLWHDGTTLSTYSATVAGTVVLQVSNICGLDMDSVIITATTEGPDVELGEDRIACNGELLTVSSGISGVQYLWQDGSTGASYVSNTSETIILVVSNNCGSDADTLQTIFLQPPQTNLGNDTTLCEGNAHTLIPQQDDFTALVWQDASTGTAFTVTEAGQYFVTATNQCGVDADTIVIAYMDVPAPFSIGNDTAICPGESIVLVAPVTSDVFVWQDGSANATMIADAARVYFLEITNQCGTTRDELHLVFDTLKPVITIDPVVLLCPDATITLDAGQLFDAQYNWSNGETTASIDVETPGEYTVTVFTNCNAASGVVDVVADDCFPDTGFYIPNIFSPNGDGVNDVFEIQFNATALVTNVEGAVYDRWGNVIFNSGAGSFSWNGEYRQQPVHPGVYLYRIAVTYETLNGLHTEVVTGDVTIVK